MRVEIWSDIVCPWCYIGKRRFERALAGFPHADEVEVVWRSFQLNPDHPKGARVPLEESLAAKMGATVEQVRAMNARVKAIAAEEGLEYDFDRYKVVNTFDAHRLTHLAKAYNLSAELHERFLRAQLVEGEVLDDPDTLVRLAAEVGVPEDEARRVLEDDDFAAEVEADSAELRALGGNGVPFFVIDRRFGISGAQPTEVFQRALAMAHDAATQESPSGR
ncbi:DsbA family oxidoreductase [Sphaerobacter sp.]|uniref:DsbA family oxidoreductase n=1 Tax=Sphaerobacter sp. TaxID=2099654 RepID=UPI001D8554A9|nr:DsbA family oxidoreductase [Sphaerobacter sp.]MBX5446784.1 DsbA family oxidoreductase [Sphaerobacter sp.]